MTMRRLGQELGVEAMSLYHHVANKDDVVQGVVDLLVGGIDAPAAAADWMAAIRDRAMAARAYFRRHPWATRLITSRQGVSPPMLRYLDWVVGVLRDGGFSPELVHSAMHLAGTRLLGFNEEAFSEAIRPDEAKRLHALLGTGEYPAMAQAMTGMRHDDDREFAFGLDIILDGLERVRDTTTRRVPMRRSRHPG